MKQKFPSCKGLCKTAQSQAIEGGCLDGCNPQFTDNNTVFTLCIKFSLKVCSLFKIQRKKNNVEFHTLFLTLPQTDVY